MRRWRFICRSYGPCCCRERSKRDIPGQVVVGIGKHAGIRLVEHSGSHCGGHVVENSGGCIVECSGSHFVERCGCQFVERAGDHHGRRLVVLGLRGVSRGPVLRR